MPRKKKRGRNILPFIRDIKKGKTILGFMPGIIKPINFKERKVVIYAKADLPRIRHSVVSFRQEITLKEKELKTLKRLGKNTTRAEIDLAEARISLAEAESAVFTAMDMLGSPEQMQKVNYPMARPWDI